MNINNHYFSALFLELFRQKIINYDLKTFHFVLCGPFKHGKHSLQTNSLKMCRFFFKKLSFTTRLFFPAEKILRFKSEFAYRYRIDYRRATARVDRLHAASGSRAMVS